ncbi:MAG: DUF933 domain-containing protein [Verrucomicrobiota bacterium]
MKICLLGIPGTPAGKYNVKDPRLDQAHKLVEADKKAYVQVDLIPEKEVADADALLVSPDAKADLILKDWEFVETRLSRNPSDAEAGALAKLKAALEREDFAFQAGLSPEEHKAVSMYNLLTLRPVRVATSDAGESLDTLLLKLIDQSGYMCFLTVGGKENRAWLIRKGTTAWEAASSIHSDLQKGFIRAEIIGFDDFIQAGGETQAKRAGKMRLEQKEYVMQDCDITNFRVSK